MVPVETFPVRPRQPIADHGDGGTSLYSASIREAGLPLPPYSLEDALYSRPSQPYNLDKRLYKRLTPEGSAQPPPYSFPCCLYDYLSSPYKRRRQLYGGLSRSY